MDRFFNTMDSSPFHEKDLDHDAEEFILSRVLEYPLHELVMLVIHLREVSRETEPQRIAEQAEQHYFAYRARISYLEFRQLMQEGRWSLLIGLVFLSGCLITSELLLRLSSGTCWVWFVKASA